RRAKIGTFALVSDLGLGCDTLGAALEQSMRLLELVTEDVVFSCETEGDDTMLCIRQQYPELDPGGFFADYWLLSLHRMFSWMVGYLIPVKRVEMTLAEPPNSDRVAFLLRGDWEPNQPRNALVFSRKYLTLPITRTRNEWRDHVQMLRQGMVDWPDDDITCSRQVRAQLLQALNQRKALPGLEQVAAALNMTPQTLRRHLIDEGSSYQRMLDELRRDAAIERLLVQHLSVADIAEQLGFAEPRSFSRAFKQW